MTPGQVLALADTAKMSDEQVGKLTALFDVFDPDGHA